MQQEKINKGNKSRYSFSQYQSVGKLDIGNKITGLAPYKILLEVENYGKDKH